MNLCTKDICHDPTRSQCLERWLGFADYKYFRTDTGAAASNGVRYNSTILHACMVISPENAQNCFKVVLIQNPNSNVNI